MEGKSDQHLNFFSTVSVSVMSCFRLHFKLPSTEVNQRGEKQQKNNKIRIPTLPWIQSITDPCCVVPPLPFCVCYILKQKPIKVSVMSGKMHTLVYSMYCIWKLSSFAEQQ